MVFTTLCTYLTKTINNWLRIYAPDNETVIPTLANILPVGWNKHIVTYPKVTLDIYLRVPEIIIYSCITYSKKHWR